MIAKVESGLSSHSVVAVKIVREYSRRLPNLNILQRRQGQPQRRSYTDRIPTTLSAHFIYFHDTPLYSPTVVRDNLTG